MYFYLKVDYSGVESKVTNLCLWGSQAASDYGPFRMAESAWIKCINLWCVSAAALSTELRTPFLSYGNVRFSGSYRTISPSTDVKFYIFINVSEITKCVENLFKSVGLCSSTMLMSLFFTYFTFFICLNDPVDQTAGPISTHNSPIDAVWCKEVLWPGDVFLPTSFRV